MENKDFSKYAYFVSRASNFAIVIRPTKKRIVDGEVVYEEGLRLEFKNKMLRVEKTEENEGILAKLREKLEAEKSQDPKRRAFFEEEEPKRMIPEEAVVEKLNEKNDRIKELEEENARLLKKKEEDK